MADGAADLDPLLSVDPWVALADGRSQLARALAEVTEAEAALPLPYPEDATGMQWVVGDLVAHLTAWDRMVATCLRAVAGGETPEEVAAPDDEWAAWNAEQVAVARATPIEEKLQALAAARDELFDAASLVPNDQLDVRLRTSWGVEETPRGILVVQAIHDGMHAEVIAEARAAGEADAT